MPSTLNLQPIDEVVSARSSLHGGTVGAPRRLEDGNQEGAALNRACVVLLTGTLQAFIEDVFQNCSNRAFGRNLSDVELKNYRNTWRRWGNPSAENIVDLFRRLGIDDVFDGLGWQNQSTPTLRKNLDKLNQIRNCIAHGQEIMIEKKTFRLQLSYIKRIKNTVENFESRFESHALSKIR